MTNIPLPSSYWGRFAVISAEIAFVVGVVVALVFLVRKAPRLAWWVIGAIAVAGLVWLYEFRLGSRYAVDPNLPVFRPFAWTWLLAFTLGALASMVALGRLVRGRVRPAEAPADGAAFPDLDAAWEAIRLRLGQAAIDPAAQRVFLILAPEEGWAAGLVRSAGLQVFAEAPGPEAPLHAYAIPEGLLLSVSAAARLAQPEADSSAPLEHVARLLRDLNPDCPVVRGIVVVFPAEWAAQGEAARRAAAVREDLRALRATLRLRLPVFALFSHAEGLPGLAEFVGRLPEPMRLSRCGFGLPGSIPFGPEVIGRGLAWLSGWFDTWCLSLMSADVENTAGNGRLFCLSDEIRRRRRRWREVLESAFSTPRDSEPVLLRGLYLAACGEATQPHAFAAGLLRGPRSRVPADAEFTAWSEEARQDDRRYLRAALAVGLAGGLLTLLAWSFIVGRHPLWWAGFVAVIAAWIAAIAWMRRRA